MAVKREYRCDLCGSTPRNMIGDPALIGLRWDNGDVIVEAPWREVERHLCAKCLSSLQALRPICGDGIRDCRGGPQCPSDHK